MDRCVLVKSDAPINGGALYAAYCFRLPRIFTYINFIGNPVFAFYIEAEIKAKLQLQRRKRQVLHNHF